VNPRFVYERMQLIDFPLGDHKRLWISEYSQLAVDLPDEGEQGAIAAMLKDCSDEVDIVRLRLLKARAIKQGMLQQLLTGRTRLPLADGAAA
jgi:type I restriction enzyme S subunit